MKKLLYCAAALATMFFSACQQENLEPAGNGKTVTFSVEAPGTVQTKAIADGLNVDQLIYEVWMTGQAADLSDAVKLYQAETEFRHETVEGVERNVATVNVDLLQDQHYTVLFWAQVKNEANPAYNTADLRAVKYARQATEQNPEVYDANDESLAAFYACETINDGTPSAKNVTLVRPFAQLNLGHYNSNTNLGYTIEVKESRVIATGVANQFNVATATSTGNVTMQFAMNDVPSDPSTFQVDGKDIKYQYLGMNYLFASDNITVEYDIETVLNEGTDNEKTASVNNTVSSVPLKRNHRTNIIGNLLTSKTEYQIIIDSRFDINDFYGPDFVQEPKQNEEGDYIIENKYELAWLAAAVNGTLPQTTVEPKNPQTFRGKTFKVVADIDLTDFPWTPIGVTGKFEGAFDGGDHTISNMVVNVEGRSPAGLFGNAQSATVKNVTVANANVQGHYKAAAVVANGVCAKIENCHVIDAVIISTPYEKDDANNVGGIVGYLAADGGSAWVKNCSVNKSEDSQDRVAITAYRKVGGIVGAANKAAEVSGNTVNNTLITADQMVEYKTDEAANAGIIAGFIHSDAILENNTESGNTLKVYLDVISEMYSAPRDEMMYIVFQNNEYTFNNDINLNGQFQAVAGSDVVLNVNNHSIEAGSSSDYAFSISGTETSLTLNDVNLNSKGGALGVSSGAKLVINSGTIAVNTGSTSGRYSVYAVGEGTEVVINGGEFKSFPSNKNQKRAYIYAGAGAKVYVNGGEFGKPATHSNYKAGILGDGEVIITGGTFGFDPSNWLAFGYKANKNAEGKWVVEYAVKSDNAAIASAVTEPGAEVLVAAGNYTFPSSKIAEGVTLNCAEGTVFEGNSKLNINGATVIGATFSNPSGTAVDQTINGTFKNCTFTGSNALRWCYAGETCVFENCVFSGSTYGVHFDGGANHVLFKDCTFSGFNAFAAATDVEFQNCTFQSNGKSGYNGANLWGNTKMVDTEFVFDGSATYEWIDACTVEKTYEFTDCTINGGTIFSSYYFGSRYENTDITIDGTLYEDFSKTSYLACAKDLFWFADQVNVENKNFSGKTVKLVADIDLANTVWTPVGQTGATTFNGVFDGQNYTISNLNINSGSQTGAHYSSGLFGWVETHTEGMGYIKNVKIDGATVVAHHNCGALVGYITEKYAVVENCHVSNATISCTKANDDADGDKAGALIGNATNATKVRDCSASTSTVSAGRDCGQLVGAAKEANVTGCVATDVTVTNNGTGSGKNIREEIIGRLL